MACTCVCAPVIELEMADWLALGGQNWGCCGDAGHTTGFHRAACQIPVTDYSRSHESAKPFNMSWACAGDFAHMGVPALRARHAELFTRRVAGDPSLSMICELIGQPWPGKGVYYWSAWENKLKLYTGAGHETWSHISWWRSRANERAYLWTPKEGSIMAADAAEIIRILGELRRLIVQGDKGTENALLSWLRAQEGVRPKQLPNGLDWSTLEPLPDSWPIMQILHAVQSLAAGTVATATGGIGADVLAEALATALKRPDVQPALIVAVKEALRTGTDTP